MSNHALPPRSSWGRNEPWKASASSSPQLTTISAQSTIDRRRLSPKTAGKAARWGGGTLGNGGTTLGSPRRRDRPRRRRRLRRGARWRTLQRLCYYREGQRLLDHLISLPGRPLRRCRLLSDRLALRRRAFRSGLLCRRPFRWRLANHCLAGGSLPPRGLLLGARLLRSRPRGDCPAGGLFAPVRLLVARFFPLDFVAMGSAPIPF